jgi:hypothetical protein
MNWWQQIFSPRKAESSASTYSRRVMDWDEDREASEIKAKQPFSDGSEEFFGQFMPRDERHWRPNKQMAIGLGITAGVLAGIGIAIWLKKTKRHKNWWQRLSGK